jgi:hypothetical protein
MMFDTWARGLMHRLNNGETITSADAIRECVNTIGPISGDRMLFISQLVNNPEFRHKLV